MENFSLLGLPAQLVEALTRMKITVPTPVQVATIPVAISGRDLLASAQTGTGKTVAYSIPLLIKLLESSDGAALILTPTRELAVQVQNTLNLILGRIASLRTVLLIGGTSMSKQFAELKRRPRIIVGTPGRIYDHLQRKSLALNETRLLIIDEADRMLDMGFGIQLDKIAEYLPKTRQTLMFSATLPPNIDKLSKKYLQNPERISIGSSVQPVAKIKQEMIHLSAAEKFPELLKQLSAREGSIIIFVKTKRGADKLSRELKNQGQHADSIHGDLSQHRRDRVIQAFRSRKIRILVATDVAARGLDIPHVMHVINYNLPECPEDYIHRIGRTGRAGAEGNALCLISPEEQLKWRAVQRLIDPQAARSSPQPHGGGNHGQPKHRGAPRHQKPRPGQFSFKKRPFKQGFSKQKAFKAKG
ncbi:MAG: DEAD/DEAH box helicase [Chlamydiales bacterium]